MQNRDKFKNINKCDLCWSDKPKQFLKAVDRNYKTGSFNYVKCSKCDLVWLSPRPRGMSGYYPKKYIAYKSFSHINSIQKFIRNFVKNHKVVAKILIKDQLYYFEKKGKILDVGTGNGSYMKVLKFWGWDTYGVEISKQAVNIAMKNGIKKIKVGDLFSAKYPSGYFDLVRFSHVMEHILSPSNELQETKRILKHKGKILILVPNIDSIFFKIFKSYWYPLDPPRHLFQYSAKTLSKLLKKQGFTDIKIKYNQSPYTLIRSVFFLLGLNNVEKRIGILAYPLGFALRVLNLLNMSDTLEITATKL